jgi:HEAT repeat protein
VSDNKSDIWRLQAQFDIQGLIDALKQEDHGIRKRAAAALRAIGAKEAVPAIRVALINEQDPDVRAILASALDTLSDMNEDVLTAHIEPTERLQQINKLIEMVESDDPEQIVDAAQQLGEIGDQIAVEPLVLVFNNMKSSMQVKLAVAEALLKLEGAPVEVVLLAALRHNDWHIRRNGAAILGQLKAEWSVEPLAKALRDPHSIVRRTARAALQRIDTPEALEILHRRPDMAQKPPSESYRPRATTSSQETIPAAPRDGLLNRLQQQKQQRAEEAAQPAQADDIAKHLQPTKPLDPDVVERIERLRQEKLLSDKENTDDHESS